METTNNNKTYRRFTTAEVRIKLLVDTAPALVHIALHDGPRFLQPVQVGRSRTPTNWNFLSEAGWPPFIRTTLQGFWNVALPRVQV